ncbi:MAG TPA: phosphoribosylglycinamide formyltransferase [Propionibacteriaceae bacterium]|nr:phosphoribosylglycinamide formyltransferase [Propionibacteriaceae bacterium]
MPRPSDPLRLVVLISGSGTLLQALIDASAAPDFGAQVVGVGADRDQITGLQRAERADISTFVHPLVRGADRAEWDRQLTDLVAKFEPSLVVMAGYMKLVGPQFLATFGGRLINSHPALLPSFPGMQGPRDALAYGVKISGATIFLVDDGVDTGIIVDQVAVRVEDDDSVEDLHERIKIAERDLLVQTVHRLATRSWHLNGRRLRWSD